MRGEGEWAPGSRGRGMTRLEQQVAELRAENEELRETIAQLREALCPPVVYPASWGLTPHESTLLRTMACRPVATRRALMLALYGDRDADDMPGPENVDATIWRMRKKLRPHGIEIQNVLRVGFRLPPASRARLAGGAS